MSNKILDVMSKALISFANKGRFDYQLPNGDTVLYNPNGWDHTYGLKSNMIIPGQTKNYKFKNLLY